MGIEKISQLFTFFFFFLYAYEVRNLSKVINNTELNEYLHEKRLIKLELLSKDLLQKYYSLESRLSLIYLNIIKYFLRKLKLGIKGRIKFDFHLYFRIIFLRLSAQLC